MQPDILQLTPAQGQMLLKTARAVLKEKFGRDAAGPQTRNPSAIDTDAGLQTRTGVFVTLKISGCLRGCIGSLVGREPLVEGVCTHAVNAAFHDPRFKPLTEKELDLATIEVSVLTPPQPLSFSDADDLIARLRPHVDGVTIRQGYHSATFLPQVWEQLPAPENFLSHLCLKAGLAADAWRTGRLDVETYQVQHFEE